jgi:hypothetical protein
MPKFAHPITADDVRKLFTYDKETGVFRRAMDRKRWKAGEVAGVTLGLGYIGLSVDGVPYKAHRLAWLYEYGQYPEGDLDHINGDPSDNRIANLRLTNPSDNNTNKWRAQKNNVSSGILGVSWAGWLKKWQVRLYVKGKLKHRSFHHDINDAAKAYTNAKVSYMRSAGLL